MKILGKKLWMFWWFRNIKNMISLLLKSFNSLLGMKMCQLCCSNEYVRFMFEYFMVVKTYLFFSYQWNSRLNPQMHGIAHWVRHATIKKFRLLLLCIFWFLDLYYTQKKSFELYLQFHTRYLFRKQQRIFELFEKKKCFVIIFMHVGGLIITEFKQ